MASLEITLREQVASYLAGRQTLRQLTAHVASALHKASNRGDRRAQDLALELELYLAEYSNGDWTRGEFHTLLDGAFRTYYVELALGATPPALTITTSSSVPLTRPVGTGFVVASA
jgi:hypothetical protein